MRKEGERETERGGRDSKEGILVLHILHGTPHSNLTSSSLLHPSLLPRQRRPPFPAFFVLFFFFFDQAVHAPTLVSLRCARYAVIHQSARNVLTTTPNDPPPRSPPRSLPHLHPPSTAHSQQPAHLRGIMRATPECPEQLHTRRRRSRLESGDIHILLLPVRTLNVTQNTRHSTMHAMLIKR